jgi:hypothetical protein
MSVSWGSLVRGEKRRRTWIRFEREREVERRVEREEDTSGCEVE